MDGGGDAGFFDSDAEEEEEEDGGDGVPVVSVGCVPANPLPRGKSTSPVRKASRQRFEPPQSTSPVR